MLLNLFLSLVFKMILSKESCTKGINYCSLCNPLTKLCLQCVYDIFVPDENGGCKKANICEIGKNYCYECTDQGDLCKVCDEGYYPDENGGCSYSDNCEISYKGKCLKCKENYILNEQINICKSLNSEDFKNCENISTSDGTCEKCLDGYFLSSQDKKCIKTENCFESIYDKCIKCNKGYYLDKSDGKCQEQNNKLLYCKEVLDGKNCHICEEDYYFDQEGNCVNSNYCEKMGNSGICNKCVNGYFLSNFGNICTNTENCYTGLKGYGICNKCKSGYYIDYKDGKCKSNQEENDYKNCVIVDGLCIECELKYYLGEDHKCANVLYCAESINGTCVQCKENYYLGLDNKCSKVEHCIYSDAFGCLECENDFYYEKNSKKCKEWDEKFKGCKYGYENKGCYNCKDNYYLNKTDKLCYDNNLNNSFYKCATTDDYGKKCASCINNYNLNNKYYRCSNIKGCVLQENDNKCLECNSYNCLNVKTGLCESNQNKKDTKYYKCKNTNEEGTACGECLEGYILDNNGFCVLDK